MGTATEGAVTTAADHDAVRRKGGGIGRKIKVGVSLPVLGGSRRRSVGGAYDGPGRPVIGTLYRVLGGILEGFGGVT